MIARLLTLAGGWKGKALIVTAVAALGFGAGWKVQGWRWDAARADAYEAGLAAARSQLQIDMLLLQEQLERERAREAEVRTIYREVPRVQQQTRDQPDCRVGDDFVRLWNRAASAATPGAAGRGDAALPAPAEARRVE
jgi:hypothetical protein